MYNLYADYVLSRRKDMKRQIYNVANLTSPGEENDLFAESSNVAGRRSQNMNNLVVQMSSEYSGSSASKEKMPDPRTTHNGPSQATLWSKWK